MTEYWIPAQQIAGMTWEEDCGNDGVGGDHGNDETVRHTRVLLLGFRVGVGPSIYTGFLSKMIAR